VFAKKAPLQSNKVGVGKVGRTLQIDTKILKALTIPLKRIRPEKCFDGKAVDSDCRLVA